MKRKLRRQIISYQSLHQYFAVLILSIISFGVTNADEKPAVALRNRPSLSIVVYQKHPSVAASVAASAAAAFDIDIILSNQTGKSIDVTEISVILPESLSSMRNSVGEIKVNEETHEVSAGNDASYRQTIKSVNTLYGSVFDTETLFFTPGTYIIKAEAVFKESGSQSTQRLYATYNLTLQPPLSAVLRGGVFGVLLLALFVPAYRALYSPYKHSVPWNELVIQFLIFFVAGSIISLTAIVLLQRLGNANLPITIVANDFWGGVIVGLFSYTVGKALHQQFFGKDHVFDLATKEKPKGIPPPAPPA